MGSTSETKKINNEKTNDSISISSIDYKLNPENTYSNKDYTNNYPLSNIQSDTRETTKLSEIKEETYPYKFIWNAGGKIVKITGSFLDAILDGIKPAIIVSNILIITSTIAPLNGNLAILDIPTIDFIRILIGIFSKIVVPIPNNPDINPIINVSALNTLDISFLLAPIALSIPISLVLSSTDI